MSASTVGVAEWQSGTVQVRSVTGLGLILNNLHYKLQLQPLDKRVVKHAGLTHRNVGQCNVLVKLVRLLTHRVEFFGHQLILYRAISNLSFHNY